MVEMVKLVHDNYDKISDTCLYLSNEYVLKFNVELHRKTDKGTRSYHREIGYTSPISNTYRVNINREFRYYFSIESTKSPKNDKRLKLIIAEKDIYFFRFKYKEVVDWFTGEQYNKLFVKDNTGKIIIYNRVNPVKCVISFNEYIEFEPSVLEINNESIIGVRVFLNSDGVSFFMNVNMVLTFYDFIWRFNMFQSAQLMINYLQRPNYGTNFYNMDTGESNEVITKDKNFNGVGFFDRVKAKKKED